MKLVLATLLCSLSLALLAAPSDELVSIFVEYRHNNIQVNETVNCTYGKMCSVSSAVGKKPSWRIELVSHQKPNGLATVVAKSFENGKFQQKATFQLRVGGDSATIMAEKTESERHEITVAVLAPNQVQGSR